MVLDFFFSNCFFSVQFLLFSPGYVRVSLVVQTHSMTKLLETTGSKCPDSADKHAGQRHSLYNGLNIILALWGAFHAR